jgi:DNA-binding transcriptional LysR family regulator
MDLLDLKIFVDVAESKSMSKTAQSVSLTQPAISLRIANMEEEFGVPMFRRDRSGAYLTEPGRRFYYYALYALSAIEAGQQSLHEIKCEPKYDILQIGIVGSLTHILMPPILSALNAANRSSHPWKIRTGDSFELGIKTSSDDLRFAYVNQIFSALPLLESIPLFEESVMLIGPKQPGTLNYRSLSSFLCSAPFILLKRGMPLRELIEKEVFTPLRLSPNMVIEVDTTDLIRQMVAQGSGYSFLPASSLWVDGAESTIKAIPLSEIKLKQSFHCIYSSTLSDSNKSLITKINCGIQFRVEQMRSKFMYK